MTPPPRRAAWAAVSLALAGCAAPDAATDAPAPPAAPRAREPSPAAPSRIGPAPAFRSDAPGDPVPAPVAGPRGELVRVGTREVTTADLGDHVLRYHPEVVGPALDRLVRIRLVESEAAREGVVLDDARVETGASRALDDRLRRIRLEYGAGADAPEVLARTTGRTVEALRADLRAAVRTDLLRERLARLDALRRDGFDLRILVAPDEATAVRAASDWRAGADGGRLAERLGLAPPAAPPPLAAADVPDAALRDRLAAAAPGTVLDPVPFDAEDAVAPGATRTAWQVFKVVRAWRASDEPWAAIAPRVESWLAEAPPTQDEVAAWEARALRRAGFSRWDGAKGFGASPPAGRMAPR